MLGVSIKRNGRPKLSNFVFLIAASVLAAAVAALAMLPFAWTIAFLFAGILVMPVVLLADPAGKISDVLGDG